MVYIVLYNSYFPEDRVNITRIEAVYTDQLEAFQAALELEKNTKCHYVCYTIIEVPEDIIIPDYQKNGNLINSYECRKDFIIKNNELYYHASDPSLIERNNKIKNRNQELKKIIEDLNKVLLEKYEKDMELYRNKKIKHPILKRIECMHLYEFPYKEDSIKIIEKSLEKLEQVIIKTKNDLNIVSN